MAPRPLWTGTLSFGLVTAPVRLYPAISEHRLHFHLIHEKDEGPIGYQKICKLEDKPVPDDEIVKAFEIRKGELVHLSDEDFEAARAGGGHAMEITDFVPLADIDPIFYAHAYYVGPGEGGDHVYALLAKAMEDSGLAAVVKFVLRDRQHLGVLRVADGLIVLEQLHFADEPRPVKGIKPEGQRVSKQELEMASKLIASYKGAWKPDKYKDTYRDELRKAIEAKERGGEVAEAPEPEEETAPDLMEALRQSIQARPRSRTRPRRAPSSSTPRRRQRAR
jgi:DNA end-binding protein Ku